MKLFVFLMASAFAQQDVCSADCEQQHVDALIQCNHDQACINEANDAFRQCMKDCDGHNPPPCEKHCYDAHEQQLGHCKEDDQACIDRANDQLDYCLGHCEHGPSGEHGPQ